jgi:hypothetical protein
MVTSSGDVLVGTPDRSPDGLSERHVSVLDLLRAIGVDEALLTTCNADVTSGYLFRAVCRVARHVDDGLAVVGNLPLDDQPDAAMHFLQESPVFRALQDASARAGFTQSSPCLVLIGDLLGLNPEEMREGDTDVLLSTEDVVHLMGLLSILYRRLCLEGNVPAS